MITGSFDLATVTFCRQIVEYKAYRRRRCNDRAELFNDDFCHRVENFIPLAPDVWDMVKYLSKVVANPRRTKPLRDGLPPRYGEQGVVKKQVVQKTKARRIS